MTMALKDRDIMRKIFVIYASAGQGHTKAAQVLHQHLKEKEPSADLRIFDALDYSTPALRQAYEAGYNFVIRHAQWLWLLIFYVSALRLPFGLSKKLHDLLNRLNSRPLYDLLEREDPELIISTHFLPCQAAAWLKQRGRIGSCLVTVVTDFGVHPFWYAEGTDLYAAASAATAAELERLGADPGRIVVTGIPVAAKRVTESVAQPELRRRLGLEPEMFTVLLVTGSFGIGPLERIAELLHRECQVLVVCARNQALFQRLSARSLPNVKILGFVQNMDQLMAACDVMVTKPGGLSISELLVQGAVPVFISAIPGQETGNVRALLKAGIGSYCRSPRAVRRQVSEYKAHPEKLQAVRSAIEVVRQPHAAEEVRNAIRARCAGPAA